jgi:predicted DNA-binding transcriptional regulator YafY
VPTEILAIVRRAVWDDRRLQIAYRDRQGARTSRCIDPLGLVSKSGVWYVVALDGANYRSFRADRIAAAELLAEHFERPPDFDLDAYWSQSMRQYQETIAPFPVTVRVPTASVDAVSTYWRLASVEQTDDSEALVRIDFPARGVALHQLVAWGRTVRIVEPLDLVPEIVTLARDLLDHYAAR